MQNAVLATNTYKATCTPGTLTPGNYRLMATQSVSQAISNVVINFSLETHSVVPQLGSIGGGTTLTISGLGVVPTALLVAVVLNVPVSTTFINGAMLCDVKAITSTQIQCVTRAHLSVDSSVLDPLALNVLPSATPSM